MDLKVVIKQMLDSGLSREQVVNNLKELGVSDAEKLFDEATAGSLKPTTLLSTPAAREEPSSSEGRGLFKKVDYPSKPEPRTKNAKTGEGETEISISDLMGKGGKSIFPARREAPKVEEKAEDADLESLQKELVEKVAPAAAESRVSRPVRNYAEPESLEGKVDETLALLKALEAINEKILDTDRRILLRLKE